MCNLLFFLVYKTIPQPLSAKNWYYKFTIRWSKKEIAFIVYSFLISCIFFVILYFLLLSIQNIVKFYSINVAFTLSILLSFFIYIYNFYICNKKISYKVILDIEKKYDHKIKIWQSRIIILIIIVCLSFSVMYSLFCFREMIR